MPLTAQINTILQRNLYYQWHSSSSICCQHTIKARKASYTNQFANNSDIFVEGTVLVTVFSIIGEYWLINDNSDVLYRFWMNEMKSIVGQHTEIIPILLIITEYSNKKAQKASVTHLSRWLHAELWYNQYHIKFDTAETCIFDSSVLPQRSHS